MMTRKSRGGNPSVAELFDAHAACPQIRLSSTKPKLVPTQKRHLGCGACQTVQLRLPQDGQTRFTLGMLASWEVKASQQMALFAVPASVSLWCSPPAQQPLWMQLLALAPEAPDAVATGYRRWL